MTNKECFGKFMKVIGDCDKCDIRIQCYNEFRDREKKEEELKNRCKLQWYKMDNVLQSLGICTTCG